MGSGNRGWNIVFGKARTAGVARLLGASKGGPSLLFWALVLAVIVGGAKFYGLW